MQEQFVTELNRKIYKNERIKIANSKTIKKHWKIMLKIKGAFPMFCVTKNETVQNLQGSNKSI